MKQRFGVLFRSCSAFFWSVYFRTQGVFCVVLGKMVLECAAILSCGYMQQKNCVVVSSRRNLATVDKTNYVIDIDFRRRIRLILKVKDEF